MRSVPIGTKGSFGLTVTSGHLANQFKDAILPEVFATPMMVLAMENAALNAIRDFLEVGESVVGTGIDIRHLAATPIRHRVTAEAEVTSLDGRRIAFAVRAFDEHEEIGNGMHERMLVDRARFKQEENRRRRARRRIQRPAIGRIGMTSSDDMRRTIRRNKLLGRWAAEKLGITGRDADVYSDALAVATLDPESSNVFSKIRKDFDAAGVVQSDEQILRRHERAHTPGREPNASNARRFPMPQRSCWRAISSRDEAGL